METTIEKTEIKKLNLKPIKDFIKKREEEQRHLKRMRKDAKLIIAEDGKHGDGNHFIPV